MRLGELLENTDDIVVWIYADRDEGFPEYVCETRSKGIGIRPYVNKTVKKWYILKLAGPSGLKVFLEGLT